jgi:hypothetical protein
MPRGHGVILVDGYSCIRRGLQLYSPAGDFVIAITGNALGAAEDGGVQQPRRKGEQMNKAQKWLTGFMGVLMVGMILAVPAEAPRKGTVTVTATRAVGMLAAAPVTSPELQQDQVKDLTF